MSEAESSGDISLSNTSRNAVECIQKMREAGQPLVLSVNGQRALIVQDAQSYQKLLELVDRLETIEGIRAGMNDLAEGRGRSLEAFRDQARRNHGIPL